jgi:hypothetical protein
MENVLKKESEYKRLKEKLANKSAHIDKLRNAYQSVSYTIALIVVAFMLLLCFLMFMNSNASTISQISHFIWFCESIILLYMIFPFQIIVSLVPGIFFSILFEYFSISRQKGTFGNVAELNDVYMQSQVIIFVFIKILLHSSLHVIACYLKMSNLVIKRDTFLKIAHMHKAHLTAQQDKQITERMIKSIMPPLFTHVFGKPEEFKKSVACVHQMRPLFIYPVSEISILFADIVGFTRMSSTKTAEELVFLLNDLYGRFDKLCEQAGCEKISTLGDCYYCVSGCLNGRVDHAKCCVEMGLLMVKEIEVDFIFCK